MSNALHFESMCAVSGELGTLWLVVERLDTFSQGTGSHRDQANTHPGLGYKTGWDSDYEVLPLGWRRNYMLVIHRPSFPPAQNAVWP